jgi:hypothetical protein
MKSLFKTRKKAILITVGIGAAVAIVALAAPTGRSPCPGTGVFCLTVNDYVPVSNQSAFEAALRQHSHDKMHWKESSGTEYDVPRPQTGQVTVSDRVQQVQHAIMGVNLTQQASFSTAADLKAVVDTLH